MFLKWRYDMGKTVYPEKNLMNCGLILYIKQPYQNWQVNQPFFVTSYVFHRKKEVSHTKLFIKVAVWVSKVFGAMLVKQWWCNLKHCYVGIVVLVNVLSLLFASFIYEYLWSSNISDSWTLSTYWQIILVTLLLPNDEVHF